MCVFNSKYSRGLCKHWKSNVSPGNKITFHHEGLIIQQKNYILEVRSGRRREYFFQNRRSVDKIIFAHTPSNLVLVTILCAAALGLFLIVPVLERKLLNSYSKLELLFSECVVQNSFEK